MPNSYLSKHTASAFLASPVRCSTEVDLTSQQTLIIDAIDSDDTQPAPSMLQSTRRHQLGCRALLHQAATRCRPIRMYLQHLERAATAIETAASQRSIKLLRSISMQCDGPALPDLKALSASLSARFLLAADCRHHVLQLQAKWRRAVLDTTQAQSSTQSMARMPLALFLGQFRDMDRQSSARMPGSSCDQPSHAYIYFEALVHLQRLVPAAMQRAIDQFCDDTIQRKSTSATAAWKAMSRTKAPATNPVTVLQHLVEDVTTTIRQRSHVPLDLVHVLREFVEQMLCSRLAAVCYMSSQCDARNAEWRRQHAAHRTRSLSDILRGHHRVFVHEQVTAFARTIEVLQELPFLVPSAMLAVFAEAMRMLYAEAEQVLGIAPHAMSSEILIRVFQYVLSRCELPFICSQLAVMRAYAASSDAELARCLAAFQAAIAQLMV